MESRKGDARRDPLEGEPEQSYGTREEFHVVIPQAFPEHLPCDLYGSASQRAECAVLCLVTQSCLTLCNPMDNSPPGSSVHGIFQARILEWVVMSSSRGSSQPRDRTQVSHIAG